MDNIHAIGLGVVVAGVIHGLGIVLACILARNVSKAEYEELRRVCSSTFILLKLFAISHKFRD